MEGKTMNRWLAGWVVFCRKLRYLIAPCSSPVEFIRGICHILPADHEADMPWQHRDLPFEHLLIKPVYHFLHIIAVQR